MKVRILIPKFVRASHRYRCEKCGMVIKQGKEYANCLIQDKDKTYRSGKFHNKCLYKILKV